jgi:hypothetical protein
MSTCRLLFQISVQQSAGRHVAPLYFVLDHHAYLKQQSTGRHVAPLYFVLDHHAYLKQQSAGRHVAPLYFVLDHHAYLKQQSAGRLVAPLGTHYPDSEPTSLCSCSLMLRA